jgi:hypothetical protein
MGRGNMRYAKIRKIVLFSVFVGSIMLAAGCLKVKAVEPSDKATDVETDASVRVIFNIKPDCMTVNTGTFILKDSSGKAVEGRISVSGKTATLKPSSSLAPGSKYSVYVTKNIKDASGKALDMDYIFSFTTTGNIVTSVDPADSAEGIPCGSIIKINFSMDADLSTVNDSTVRLVDGSDNNVAGEVSSNGRTAVFKPILRLSELEKYTLSVTTGVKDLKGKSIIREYVSTFTTRVDAWSEPERINVENEYAYSPHVSMDDDNNAFILWWQYADSASAILRKEYQNGSFSTIPDVMSMTAFSQKYVDYPQVAMNKKGKAVVFWIELDGVLYRLYSSTFEAGTWSKPVAVSDAAGGISNAKIALSENGSALLAWLQTENEDPSTTRVRFSLLKNDTWSPPESIGEPEGIPYEFQLAISSSGKAIIAWTEQCSINYVLTFGRIFRKEYNGESWGSTERLNNYTYTIGSLLTSTIDPEIIMEENGDAIMVWCQKEKTSAEAGDQYVSRIYKSERHNGVWDEKPAILSREGVDASRPKIAMNRFGDAQILWLEKEQTYGISRHNGIWDIQPEYIFTLSVCTDSDGTGYHMVMDSSGKVRILVSGYNIRGNQKAQIFRTEFTRPQESLLTAVSSPDSDALNLRLAADGRGNAIAVWEQKSDDGKPSVFMSEFR